MNINESIRNVADKNACTPVFLRRLHITTLQHATEADGSAIAGKQSDNRLSYSPVINFTERVGCVGSRVRIPRVAFIELLKPKGGAKWVLTESEAPKVLWVRFPHGAFVATLRQCRELQSRQPWGAACSSQADTTYSTAATACSCNTAEDRRFTYPNTGTSSC